MNFFKTTTLVALIFLTFHIEATIAQENPNLSKSEIKEKFSKLTLEARLEALARADITEKKMDKLHRESSEKISEIDMVEELKQLCGSLYNYLNDASKANVSWPTVTCKYHQAEKVLGGSTNKFLCDFSETKKNGEKIIKTRKVKYLAFGGVNKSELIPSILASTMARMVGFPTESYCPALVKCENCPSNMPWEFGRGRGRGSYDTYDFKDAMVEIQSDLIAMTPNTARESAGKAHGVDLNELVNIRGTEKKSSRDKAIEREAWLLWLNFIVEMDATSSNQRLACDKYSQQGSEIYCDKPIMYTHDYGQSFYRRFQFDKWKSVNPLIQNTDETCQGGMTPQVMKETNGSQNHIEVGPIISSEARDFLVSRLRRISDKQWRDILRISNAQRLLKVTPDEFLNAVKIKIEIMEKIRCTSFDSRTTVLSADKK